MKHKRSFQGLLLTLLTAFFSAATIVLGAVPMHALRQKFGRMHFIVAMSAVMIVMYFTGFAPIAAMMLILSSMILIFNELDERKVNVFKAGFFSVLTASSMAYFAIQFHLYQTGQALSEVVRKPIEQFVAQVKSVQGSESALVVEDLIAQVPSGMIIALIIALALAVLFETRMAYLFQYQPNQERRTDLVKFKVPDPVLWLLLASLLFAFYQGPWPESVRFVASNVLNVLLIAYFFQGIAVITVFFETYKVSPFWRMIWYVFIILQLFLFVSCLGFVDFWLDFRARLEKKRTPTKELKDKGGWT